jgi:hypothetical protein
MRRALESFGALSDWTRGDLPGSAAVTGTVNSFHAEARREGRAADNCGERMEILRRTTR